jgi:hypothetical protein
MVTKVITEKEPEFLERDGSVCGAGAHARVKRKIKQSFNQPILGELDES